MRECSLSCLGGDHPVGYRRPIAGLRHLSRRTRGHHHVAQHALHGSDCLQAFQDEAPGFCPDQCQSRRRGAGLFFRQDRDGGGARFQQSIWTGSLRQSRPMQSGRQRHHGDAGRPAGGPRLQKPRPAPIIGAAARTTDISAAKADARTLTSGGPSSGSLPGEGPSEAPSRQQTVVKDDWDKTPRNAPCPCGSGKKFKQCHG